MPLYEFKCSQCDQPFEELVTSADEAILCPSCGSAEIQKLVSVFASGQQSQHSPKSSSCGSRGKFT